MNFFVIIMYYIYYTINVFCNFITVDKIHTYIYESDEEMIDS